MSDLPSFVALSTQSVSSGDDKTASSEDLSDDAFLSLLAAAVKKKNSLLADRLAAVNKENKAEVKKEKRAAAETEKLYNDIQHLYSTGVIKLDEKVNDLKVRLEMKASQSIGYYNEFIKRFGDLMTHDRGECPERKLCEILGPLFEEYDKRFASMYDLNDQKAYKLIVENEMKHMEHSGLIYHISSYFLNVNKARQFIKFANQYLPSDGINGIDGILRLKLHLESKLKLPELRRVPEDTLRKLARRDQEKYFKELLMMLYDFTNEYDFDKITIVKAKIQDKIWEDQMVEILEDKEDKEKNFDMSVKDKILAFFFDDDIVKDDDKKR